LYTNGLLEFAIAIAQQDAHAVAGIVIVISRGAMPAEGQLEVRSEFGTNTSPNSMVVADFNRDGKMDIAVSSY
jgi:hypothetical protein